MRRIATTLVLALGLAGCGGQQVPLVIEETGGQLVCFGDLWLIADVIADPTTGTPTDAATGEPFEWPDGYTARRVLFGEVEVLDPQGMVVLTTGARYAMCPAWYLDAWVIVGASPCPGGELGTFQSLRGNAGPHPKCNRPE